MIIHYLKLALRNLQKYKVQSAICITGLAIGLAFFIFGVHWLRYETSYDGFYPKADRTYMAYIQLKESGRGETAPVLADYLRRYCPQAESVTCSFQDSGMDYASEDILVKAPDFWIVDSSFIDIFPQNILYGTSIRQESEVIISETMARKYWKRPQDAVGAFLKQQAPQGIVLVGASSLLHIVGVMADAPENSSLRHDGYVLQNSSERDVYNAKNWSTLYAYVHFTLKVGTDKEDFSRQLNTSLHHMDFLKEHQFKVISLSEKHFEFTSEKSFTYSSIRMFATASLLLLCCVLFNFLNLCLNRYYQRSREMKLRKSVGAAHRNLLAQLAVEILAHSLLACLLCGCLLEVFKPLFEEVLLISIQGNEIWKEYAVVTVCTLVATEAILFLPAWQFIRMSAGHSLIVKARTHRHSTFRRASLVIQLTICLFFLASTTILYKQLCFIRQTDPGFDTQHVIEMVIATREQKGQDMLEEIKRLPMITHHATVSQPMVNKQIRNLAVDIEWEGMTEEDKKMQMLTIDLTKEGTDIFRFRLLKGRMFAEADWQASDNMEKDVLGMTVLNKVLVNEKAVAAMRLTDPVGKIIRIPYHFYQNGLQTYYNDYEIIGVVKDFHIQGMKYESFPGILMQTFRFASPVHYFQVMPGSEAEALKAINGIAQKHGWEYEKLNKEPQLLNHKFKELSKSETTTFRLFSVLAAICVLISLFGIYSISFSTIRQRRKEMAIRKIMGASAQEIMRLFLLEYTALAGISGMIAFPLAYAVMSRWLEQYAYHIYIGIPLFALIWTGLILLIGLTVMQQVHKAAGENPAEVIKSE